MFILNVISIFYVKVKVSTWKIVKSDGSILLYKKELIFALLYVCFSILEYGEIHNLHQLQLA